MSAKIPSRRLSQSPGAAMTPRQQILRAFEAKDYERLRDIALELADKLSQLQVQGLVRETVASTLGNIAVQGLKQLLTPRADGNATTPPTDPKKKES